MYMHQYNSHEAVTKKLKSRLQSLLNHAQPPQCQFTGILGKNPKTGLFFFFLKGLRVASHDMVP